MDNLPEHIEMKIKRPLHLRCRLSDKLHAPKPLGDRLQASLAHTYNHLDRLRFLEQFQLFTPSTSSSTKKNKLLNHLSSKIMLL